MSKISALASGVRANAHCLGTRLRNSVWELGLGARFGRTLLMPAVFHRLNFTADLSAVNQLAALGLQESFFDMRRQGLPFLVGPAFLGVLSFKSAAEDIFDAGITAAGKPFVD